MTHYLLHLGEFCSSDSESYHYKWSDLYRGSYDGCKKQFHTEMVNVFSQYGEDWGDLQLSDIQSQRISPFKITTDGTYLHLDPVKDKDKDKHKQSHKCQYCPINEQILISYGTSGGLNLSFSALVISNKTHITYIPDGS